MMMQIRGKPHPSPMTVIDEDRSQLTSTLNLALREIRAGSNVEAANVPGLPAESAPVLWDAIADTKYAHEIDGMKDLLHVFQQNWYGIRAAAGSLPGRKVALRQDSALPKHQVRQLVRQIMGMNPQRIVIQGMSDALGQVVEELASQDLQDRTYVVFHGAPSQWFSEPEARYAFKCLELARSGRIRRLHVMKAGFEYPESRLFKAMLFNLPPNLKRGERIDLSAPGPEAINTSKAHSPAKSALAMAFIPGWEGWRKNVHSNALGAALSERVGQIVAFANNLTLPPPFEEKISLVPFFGREQTFGWIRKATFLMNISLVDCHPMVHLEAHAHGKPCLRGPLFLDALEDHPYVHLTQVNDVSSLSEIRSAVDRVLDVPCGELLQLVNDYQAESNHVAVSRYFDFLEI